MKESILLDMKFTFETEEELDYKFIKHAKQIEKAYKNIYNRLFVRPVLYGMPLTAALGYGAWELLNGYSVLWAGSAAAGIWAAYAASGVLSTHKMRKNIKSLKLAIKNILADHPEWSEVYENYGAQRPDQLKNSPIKEERYL